MWREYTREKPARRGWSLVMSAAVFAGSMALAWGLTTGRISTSRMGSWIDFDGWPFRFSVPSGYELRNASSVAAEGDARGPGGLARYDISDREGRRSLTIGFNQWPADLTWPELRSRLDLKKAESEQDVSLGKWEWRIFESGQFFSTAIELTAVHAEPDGLVVVVHTRNKAKETQPFNDLVSLCRSIRIK